MSILLGSNRGATTVPRLEEIHIAAEPIQRFQELIGDDAMQQVHTMAHTAARRLDGRTWWTVNSTARGGGVAEMLHSLLGYARGAGIDVRWAVIAGPAEFFQITKRLHHRIHGMVGDGGPLGDAERKVYETVLAANADELTALIRPSDIVLLHDPQTAGLAPVLSEHGAIVIWRSHVGADVSNEHTERAWEFLRPYLDASRLQVFSRAAYRPEWMPVERCVVISPSIDAFSPKNQWMDSDTVRAILVHTGLVEGPVGRGQTTFCRADGSPARVDHQADIVRLGRAPAWETPLVVQVSRWDPLKDPVGVIRGFSEMITRDGLSLPELLIAGPNVTAVADDPEASSVFAEVLTVWRALPHAVRGRVHLASLPMADIAENAAIVNAIQRHAAVVVQKSLREGFGLTVTEAMWKGRPVVASRVGGIQEQIIDGKHGLLLDNPSDPALFASVLRRVLTDQELAARLGHEGHERVKNEFLGVRHLVRYAELLESLEVTSSPA